MQTPQLFQTGFKKQVWALCPLGSEIIIPAEMIHKQDKSVALYGPIWKGGVVPPEDLIHYSLYKTETDTWKDSWWACYKQVPQFEMGENVRFW